MNFGKVGDTVKHPKHGKGKITKLLGANQDDGARVKLASGKSVTVDYGDEDAKKWRRVKESTENATKIVSGLLEDGEPGTPVESGLVSISCDWKDPSELIDELIKRLPGLGIYAVRDPVFDGGDQLGLLLSKTPITKEMVKDYMVDLGFEDEDAEGEEGDE